tara:strand:+ start:1377 stop:1700 length:324 start_codon:yes stop_codon:yes gene_type:complete
MGFFSRLGNKISGGAHRLGHKIHKASGDIHRIAHKVSDVAGKVANVAGVINKVSTLALPFTAEIPILGEVVAGTAAVSKGVQLGARGISKVAKYVDRGAMVANKITR